jgi:hypothetical protein
MGYSKLRKASIALIQLSLAIGLVLAQSFSDTQIAEDIDYLNTAVIDNYPYLEVHKRKDNFDWVEAVRRIPKRYGQTTDKKRTVEILKEYLRGLNGHAHFLDEQLYAYYLDSLERITKDFPEYKAWVDVLVGGNAKTFYGSAKGKARAPLVDLRGTKQRFDKELIGNMVYIKVPTFDFYYQKEEGAKIVEYLKNMSDKDKCIVIDVRGNSGGSDLFWLDSIVKPLITQKIEYRNYSLFVGGALSRPFLDAKKIVLSDAASLPAALKRSENRNLRYFAVDTQDIEPAATHIICKKVYVLMDSSNFSSSESFVHFCKSTGFATLVGQRSSGDGVGFDPILIQLPNTGLIFTLPIDGALNSDGMLNFERGTEPDITLEINVDSKAYVYNLIRERITS